MLRTLLLIISSFTALYFGFLHFEVEGATDFVGKWGYWLVFVPSLLLLLNLFTEARSILLGLSRRKSQIVKGHGIDNGSAFIGTASSSSLDIWMAIIRSWNLKVWPGVFVTVVAVVLFYSQPREFKIVMDEPVLAATAQQMHLEKEAFFFVQGYRIQNVYYPVTGGVDKRPLFFPFLMSTLHDLTGYRSNQGVILNAILLPVFFILVYQLGARFDCAYGGVIAVLLFATSPLLAMNAASGGFDLLNLVMILAAGMACEAYVGKPTPERMNRLLLLTVLLAQTRYESVIFIFPVAVAVLYVWWRQRKVEVTWTMVAVPLLLLTYPLQRLLMETYGQHWQLREGYDVAFSFSFIPGNVKDALGFFFSMGGDSLNSLIITVGFVFALVVWLVGGMWRLARSSIGAWVFISFSLIICLNFGMLLAYHWGQIDDVIATRLALPLILFQVCSILVVCAMGPYFRRFQFAYVCMLTVFFIGVTRPTLARTDFLEGVFILPEVNWISDFSLAHGDQPILLLSDKTLASSINFCSSLNVREAMNDLPALELHCRLKTFDEMFIIYTVFTEYADADKHAKLKDLADLAVQIERNFELEIVEDRKVNDAIYVRVARVVDIPLGDLMPLDIDTDGLSISYTGKIHAPEQALQAYFNALPQ